MICRAGVRGVGPPSPHGQHAKGGYRECLECCQGSRQRFLAEQAVFTVGRGSIHRRGLGTGLWVVDKGWLLHWSALAQDVLGDAGLQRQVQRALAGAQPEDGLDDRGAPIRYKGHVEHHLSTGTDDQQWVRRGGPLVLAGTCCCRCCRWGPDVSMHQMLTALITGQHPPCLRPEHGSSQADSWGAALSSGKGSL